MLKENFLNFKRPRLRKEARKEMAEFSFPADEHSDLSLLQKSYPLARYLRHEKLHF